ncbi:MAG: nuoB1H [Elusimicrobia bacterium]|nr:MAG: nuoB1H [Elusimicrobiota bacterium]
MQEDLSAPGILTSRMDEAVGWARKYSLFPYPFVTACCGMEFMSVSCSHYDVDRFGAAFPRFSPRQADVLMVVGTISHKIAPVLRRTTPRSRASTPSCRWTSTSRAARRAPRRCSRA